MVTSRRALLVLALLAGGLAAAIYHAANATTDVLVVARDVEIPRPLAADDLELRTVAAGLAPADALTRPEDVIGLIPRGALTRGQLLVARGLVSELGDFRSGIGLGPGERAIAIPVDAVSAVGGALAPGSRVDVLAVPIVGRAPAGRAAELLTTMALVLDVRGEGGAPFVPKDPKLGTMATDRIASVVIAIAVLDEVRFADRIATSTFVLALASAR